MKNKKKKGFTLIELLAIIVILAIIAVITVPIILNIIDNSKKGAATDSAYGYKDAINKWYVTELSKPENQNLILSGEYTVSAGGVLNGTGITNKEIPVSGDKPSSGYLNYSNNTLISGCLIFGDYAVTFTNGTVTLTTKGTCPANSQQGGETTPLVAIYASKGDTETKKIEDIAVGDYVKLGDDGFYVIAVPQTETSGIPTYNQVLLLTEYSIDNNSALGGWRQSEEFGERMAFSESYYWEDCIATSSNSQYTCSEPYGHLYLNENSGGFVYDSNSNLYIPMEAYKDYLEGIIGEGKISKIRPMSFNEANAIKSNSWAHSDEYWLGTEGSAYMYGSNSVWYMDINGNINRSTNAYQGNNYCMDLISTCYFSPRPLIEISTAAFE